MKNTLVPLLIFGQGSLDLYSPLFGLAPESIIVETNTISDPLR
jgi:hypothetical protein